MIEILYSPETLAALMRSLIPLLLLGLGGLLCHRVGVFNVALEGFLLVGAFAALAGATLSGNAYVGVIVAAAAGIAVSSLIAVGGVVRRADPIVVGISVNLLITGLTSFLLFIIFGVRGTLQVPGTPGLPRIAPSFLTELPWIGSMLGTITLLGVFAIVATFATQFILARTVSGLRLRGVGMMPDASATLGINPSRYQIVTILVSGLLGGLAGAQLSLGSVALFTENMSAGRGWIVVVAVLLSNGRVWPLFGILALFGYVDALGIRLQNFGFPVQFSDAAPYLVTLIALVLIAALRRRKPTGFFAAGA